jgi:hypothetical protein
MTDRFFLYTGLTLLLSYVFYPEDKALTIFHLFGGGIFMWGLFMRSLNKGKKEKDVDRKAKYRSANKNELSNGNAGSNEFHDGDEEEDDDDDDEDDDDDGTGVDEHYNGMNRRLNNLDFGSSPMQSIQRSKSEGRANRSIQIV